MIDDEVINKVTKQMFDEAPSVSPSEPTEVPSQAQATDYYQAQRNAAYEASQKATVNGSPAQIGKVVDDMVEDFKQTNYNVNKNQYDHLLDYELKDNAEYLRQDYMTNSALPMVESLVETYGVDAIINNKGALDKLDEIMISPNGSGKGFTKGYLEQMHEQQRGSQGSDSDIEVSYALKKIRNMAGSDDIRGSVDEARRIKDKVDNGELSASDDDYQMLLQVASYK